MARIVTFIGDIFVVKISDEESKYFQYIANDMSQLNSSVIRAFKTGYSNDKIPSLEDIVSDTVDFYAHVSLRNGIEDGLWEKIGKSSKIGALNILFRDSEDYGNPEIKISKNWYVWKINEDYIDIGKLEGEYIKADIGVIVLPEDVVDRMKTGQYHFFYPSY